LALRAAGVVSASPVRLRRPADPGFDPEATALTRWSAQRWTATRRCSSTTRF